jgi:hypothetical protein
MCRGRTNRTSEGRETYEGDAAVAATSKDAARVDAGKAVRFGKVAVAANGRSAQREASRAQRLKSIFNCLSSATF